MRASVISLVLLNFLIEYTDSWSGLYKDNEYDQTELDWSLTAQEKHDMELDILNLLGLPNRPKKINGSHIRKSAPRFLLDIYKALMDKENDENNRTRRSVDLNLSGEEQNAIDESDVIMTIESINHHVSGVRHERGKRLWFNVSDVPIAENIVGAELRIYQNEKYTQKKESTQFTVTAYQLIKTDSGERELEFVSAVNTSARFSGWLGLNLTACLSSWVAFPDSNKGLYLSVHAVDKPGREVRPEDIGLVTMKGEDENQPFMVVFLKATNHVKVRRSVRDTRRRVKKSNYANLMKSAATPDLSPYDTPKSCKIRTLYISFKDINWMDWIIAPDGYAAYYCAGDCNFPLNAVMNATNHAIVQTLVHLMSPLRFPKPCCAPTKLSAISVLYFLDDTNVMLKKFKRMVVKSCGCH